MASFPNGIESPELASAERLVKAKSSCRNNLRRKMRQLKPFLFVAAAVLCAAMIDQRSVVANSNPSALDAALVESSTPLKFDKLDASIGRIIPADAMLERIATGYTWTEGPVWANDSLFFADIPGNSIQKWTPDAGASTFIKPSGYKGSVPYSGPEPGSNGMTLDSLGRLTVAGHARRNVWRLESLNSAATVTVLADTYEGKELNSPNDVVYKLDGSLYFTDPPYGL